MRVARRGDIWACWESVSQRNKAESWAFPRRRLLVNQDHQLSCHDGGRISVVAPHFMQALRSGLHRCERFSRRRTSTVGKLGDAENPHMHPTGHGSTPAPGPWGWRSDVRRGGRDASFGLSNYSNGASVLDGSSSLASHEIARRGSADTGLTRCHSNRPGSSLQCL